MKPSEEYTDRLSRAKRIEPSLIKRKYEAPKIVTDDEVFVRPAASAACDPNNPFIPC